MDSGSESPKTNNYNYRRFKIKSFVVLYKILSKSAYYNSFLKYIFNRKLQKSIIRTKINSMELLKEGTLRGHEDYISCLVKLDNNYLASGGMDKIIYIWDLLINECISTLKGHTDIINCIIPTLNDQIASCSDDCKIKLWNYKVGILIRTFEYKYIIKSMIFFHNYLLFGNINNHIIAKSITNHQYLALGAEVIISDKLLNKSFVSNIIKLGQLSFAYTSGISIFVCSVSNVLFVYKPGVYYRYHIRPHTYDLTFENFTEHMLGGHFSDVNCIAELNSTQLISCSDDKNIKIWNYHHGKCKKTLSGHKDRVVQVIKMNELHLVSCSKDETIKLWETIKGTCLYTITSKNLVLSIIRLNDNQIARGGRTTIKIIDIFNKLLI